MQKKSLFIVLTLLFGAVFAFQGCSHAEKKENVKDSVAVSNPASETMGGVPGPKTLPATPVEVRPSGPFKLFNVYTDSAAEDNHFFSTGWMGDYGDIKFNDKSTVSPHSGSTCIEIGYTGKSTQGARWAGIYWQNPANNWGTRPGGYDLTGAKKLTFWARGAKGGEKIEEFKIGGITGEYADSDVAGIGPVVLTTDWQQFTIDLEGKDLSSISGGFCWTTNLDSTPQGCTIYLDDIRYE